MTATTGRAYEMNTIATFRKRCRDDRNALYAVIGVSFWALLPLALFAGHGLARVWPG